MIDLTIQVLKTYDFLRIPHLGKPPIFRALTSDFSPILQERSKHLTAVACKTNSLGLAVVHGKITINSGCNWKTHSKFTFYLGKPTLNSGFHWTIHWFTDVEISWSHGNINLYGEVFHPLPVPWISLMYSMRSQQAGCLFGCKVVPHPCLFVDENRGNYLVISEWCFVGL